MWSRAGLATVLSGELVDPEIAELKRLTSLDRIWDCPEWPPEERGERATRVASCHHLALALGDVAWMQGLHRAWEDAPVDPNWRDLSRGQLELGLAGHAVSWADEGLEMLIEDGDLSPEYPNHRAWIALGRGDLEEAWRGVEEYRVSLDQWSSGWAQATGQAIGRILDDPGRILRVELRALQSLLRDARRLR